MGFIFFSIGFTLIVTPIVSFISLRGGVDLPFWFLIVALVSVAIDINIITYKIIDKKRNDSNQEGMERIKVAIKAITIAVAVCLIPIAWSVSEEGEKAKYKADLYNYSVQNRIQYSSHNSGRSSSSANSNYEINSSSSTSSSTLSDERKQTCIKTGCDQTRSKGMYCVKHVCYDSGCSAEREEHKIYCSEHRLQTSNSGKYRIGVEDYDNPDDYAHDFAEDYAYDEFGKDDSYYAYDYGYEQAYNYWMDEMEK